MQLRTINKALSAKYPGLELVKGEGYFYFAGAGVEMISQETGVYVYKLNDLTLDHWIAEADRRMAEVAQIEADQKERGDGAFRIKLSGSRKH